MLHTISPVIDVGIGVQVEKPSITICTSTDFETNPLTLFRPNLLINLNEYVGERGLLRQVGGDQQCLASWFFYDNPKNQISAVFRSIIKNHPFVNGNKRTAVLFALTIAEFYSLEVVNDEILYDLSVKLPSTDWDPIILGTQLFKGEGT